MSPDPPVILVRADGDALTTIPEAETLPGKTVMTVVQGKIVFSESRASQG